MRLRQLPAWYLARMCPNDWMWSRYSPRICPTGIRPIAFNRKNALFAGHYAGAENWATIASLIETSKLNAVDPLAYLTAHSLPS